MSGSDYLISADDDYDLSYDPPPPPKRSGSLRMIWGIVAVIVVLAGAGVVGAVALRGHADSNTDAVRLEPTSFAGANPFVSPVGKDQPVAAVAAGGEFSGTTAGLYARNPAIPSCDGQALVAALQADDKRAAAWAGAENIQAAEIPAFVAGLTPVLLRADTAVTAFGYDEGSFFAYPAVLQAGTSVLINGRGEPTVKCFSGNPLASRAQPAPTPSRSVSYVGPSWSSFRTTSVTVVRPSTIINKTFCVGGTGVGGAGGNGGNGAAAGAGGNGGSGTGGAGCVVVSGTIGITDCKQHPKADGCTPQPPPTVPPGPVNCTKDPTATGCSTTPGDPGKTPPVDAPRTPQQPGAPPHRATRPRPHQSTAPRTPQQPGAPPHRATRPRPHQSTAPRTPRPPAARRSPTRAPGRRHPADPGTPHRIRATPFRVGGPPAPGPSPARTSRRARTSNPARTSKRARTSRRATPPPHPQATMRADPNGRALRSSSRSPTPDGTASPASPPAPSAAAGGDARGDPSPCGGRACSRTGVAAPQHPR